MSSCWSVFYYLCFKYPIPKIITRTHVKDLCSSVLFYEFFVASGIKCLLFPSPCVCELGNSFSGYFWLRFSHEIGFKMAARLQSAEGLTEAGGPARKMADLHCGWQGRSLPCQEAPSSGLLEYLHVHATTSSDWLIWETAKRKPWWLL